MKIFKRKIKQDQPIKQPEKKTDIFIIEYYPIAGVYMVNLNNEYLKKGFPIPWIESSKWVQYGTVCKSHEEALKLIEMYKEQKHKKKVIFTEYY